VVPYWFADSNDYGGAYPTVETNQVFYLTDSSLLK